MNTLSHSTALQHQVPDSLRVAMHAPLHVALVTETFAPEINGVAMTLQHLVNGLVERGHRIQVVRPRQGPHDSAHCDDRIEEVLAIGVPLPNYGGLRFGLPMGNALERSWRRHRPDLVHVATEGPLGWSAVSAAKRLGLPVTSSFHTNFHSYSGHYGLSLLKSPIDAYLRALHNKTGVTLVPTRALVHELTLRGYRKVQLMSRGVDTQLFQPARRSAALRASWGVGTDDVVVCHVGRLAPEKNIALVLASFAQIQRVCPQAKLLFVGDGPMRATVQAQCPQALFAGMRSGEDLAAHYASADLFLFPSRTDTFGNVVPEALASGLCVLSFNQAAAAEIVQDGVNARVVEPGDERAFVAAACTLASDGALRATLRQQAAPSVARLAWSAVQEGFIDTLRAHLTAHRAAQASERTAGMAIAA